MREYLLRIVCAAFLCSMLSAINGPGKGARKWISGLFLVMALLRPSFDISLPELSLEPILEEAQTAVQDGTMQSQKARDEIISDSLEAYILNKAAELGLHIDVRVALSAEGTPASVDITGSVSALEREALEDFFTGTLDLGKEDLVWNQTYQSCE